MLKLSEKMQSAFVKKIVSVLLSLKWKFMHTGCLKMSISLSTIFL